MRDETPALIFAILLYLYRKMLDQVFSELLSAVVFEGHSAGPLAVNITSVSEFLDERLGCRVLDFEDLGSLTNAQILFGHQLHKGLACRVAD